MLNKSVSLSALALIAANSIPLIGVLFYDWDSTLILALFWIENLIVGGFNLLKMLVVVVRGKNFGDLFTCGFFVLHYGFFCSIHGLILWDILELGELNPKAYFPNMEPGFLEAFSSALVVLLRFIEMFGGIILLGIAALLLSHLVSFIENFLIRGEIFNSKVKNLMGKPYPRVFILHAGIILGALALEKLGSPVWLLVVVVLFKIIVDLIMFLDRHKEVDQQAVPKGN